MRAVNAPGQQRSRFPARSPGDVGHGWERDSAGLQRNLPQRRRVVAEQGSITGSSLPLKVLAAVMPRATSRILAERTG